jgi:hypothetical protein
MPRSLFDPEAEARFSRPHFAGSMNHSRVGPVTANDSLRQLLPAGDPEVEARFSRPHFAGSMNHSRVGPVTANDSRFDALSGVQPLMKKQRVAEELLGFFLSFMFSHALSDLSFILIYYTLFHRCQSEQCLITWCFRQTGELA